MVRQYTEEPDPAKENGGKLGVFPPGGMVPEFEAGVKALAPGEVSPSLVQTSHGFHIIRRHLLPEVRAEFVERLGASSLATQRDEYINSLRTSYRYEVKPEAAAKAREVATTPNQFRGDRSVLASTRLGNFTAGRLAEWIEVIPPQMRIRDQLAGAPDSVVLQLVRSIVDQEIIGDTAAKAGHGPDSTEMARLRGYFGAMVQSSMMGLRVDPSTLGDSARSTSEKERLAAVRVEEAIDQLFATSGQSGLVEIPVPLMQALRKRYSWRVTQAGLDRALERAQTIRISYDSSRAGTVPMPNMPPGAVPPGAVPPPPPPGGR
jgi:hypothetical protein